MVSKLVIALNITMMAAATAIAEVQKNSVLIGDNFFFADTTTTRTRAEALAFCAAQDGELAKITEKKFYTMLTRSVAIGNYWIDGMDKSDSSRFQLATNCTSTAALDLKDIPPANLDFPAASCLNLYRGATATASKIQAIHCGTSLRGVICSVPLDGCQAPTISPTFRWRQWPLRACSTINHCFLKINVNY